MLWFCTASIEKMCSLWNISYKSPSNPRCALIVNSLIELTKEEKLHVNVTNNIVTVSLQDTELLYLFLECFLV